MTTHPFLNLLKSAFYTRTIVIFNTTTLFRKLKFRLPMASPLSCVLAYFYLKFLESGLFIFIIPSNSNYFRYLDDILLINPQEVDLKAPFSIATTPRCRGGRYSFPWIALLYSWSLPYSAEWQARQHQVPFFESLVGLEPSSSRPFANTILIRPRARLLKIIIAVKFLQINEEVEYIKNYMP